MESGSAAPEVAAPCASRVTPVAAGLLAATWLGRAAWVALGGLFLVSLPRLASRWLQAGSAFEHGPLAVVAGLWLLVRSRTAAGAPPGAGAAAAGVGLALAGAWLHHAAARERLPGPEGLGLLAALLGLVTLTRGARALRAAALPAALLASAVPWPALVVTPASAALRELATTLGALALEGAGVAFVRDGHILRLSTQDLHVDDACAGLRGLLGIFAFALLAAAHAATRGRAAAALVLAAPVAVLGNVLRLLVLVGCALGPGVPDGWRHEALGLLVYLPALLLLAAVAAPEGPAASDLTAEGSPAEGSPAGHAAGRTPPRHLAALAATSVAFAAAAGTLARAPAPSVERRGPASAPPSGAAVPLALPDDLEARLAGARVTALRLRTGPDRAPVDVYVIEAGDDLGAIGHPAEGCLPGAGWHLEAARSATLDVQGAEATVRVTQHVRAGERLAAVTTWSLDGRWTVPPAGYAWSADLLLRRLRGAPLREAAMLRVTGHAPEDEVLEDARRLLASRWPR